MFLFLIYCLLFTINVDSNQWDGYHRQLDDESPPINWKDCGISARNFDPSPNTMVITRIEGGVFAENGEFPWFALVDRYSSNYIGTCGGSIINEWWILTAAHCVHKESVRRIIVSIGSVDRLRINDGRRIDIKRVVIHNRYLEHERHRREFYKIKEELIRWERSGNDITEEFKAKHSKFKKDFHELKLDLRLGNSRSAYYDVALLELSERIVPVFNDSHYLINSICLPKTNITNRKNENLVVIGMGATSKSESAPTSDKLKKGIALLLNPRICNYAQFEPGYENELQPMVCTNRVEQITSKKQSLRPIDNASPCSGDSGSPSHQYNGSKAVQIGLVANIMTYAIHCGAPGYHSRVSLFMPWIRSVVLKRKVLKSGKAFETIEAKFNHLLIVSVITASVIAVVVCSALLWILVTIQKTRPTND